MSLFQIIDTAGVRYQISFSVVSENDPLKIKLPWLNKVLSWQQDTLVLG